ncbi:LysR substrate-binding domain-containing protein [Cryptosporangium sp. NPDC048952]|uniref:LysR substrate-binding domain-containing protein n=1 Tax=Cryptosporangium sp. NPDC048952 TaxID=3363961 RepID=UPI0037197027
MLDVRRLRLLRDLAHLGTISAVAEAHSYTASAVSQQLAALQREAGVPLLERYGRRVRLTSAGDALVEHAEVLLGALEAADATLAAARGGLTGPLRIGAFPSAVRTLLPGALTTLGRDHPHVELHVSELDPVDVPAALRDRRLDVALVHDYDLVPASPDPTVEWLPLVDEAVFLAVSGDHPGTLAAAADAQWIVGSPGTLCHTLALRLCHDAGFPPRVRHHADDFTAVLALVAAGQGVAVVPQLGVEHLPPPVRLHTLPIRRRTRIAFRRGSAAHPAVAACVAALSSAASGSELPAG